MSRDDAHGGATLVVGGTGKTGRRVTERLAERGVATRPASRATSLPFDWDDPTTWQPALDGVRAAYVTFAPDLAIPGAANKIENFVDLAIENEVRRLVLLSGRGEEEAQRCERMLQRPEFEWTIVRASWFNQNFSEGAFLDLIYAGQVALPAGDVGEPFVDADDIADVVVAALMEDGHHGRVYELTGPRLLTFAQAVDEIAWATGRPISYAQIDMEAFAARVADVGLPENVAWLLEYLFSAVLDGRNASVADGVQRVLGREPMDFADFARRVAATGAWDPPA